MYARNKSLYSITGEQKVGGSRILFNAFLAHLKNTELNNLAYIS